MQAARPSGLAKPLHAQMIEPDGRDEKPDSREPGRQ